MYSVWTVFETITYALPRGFTLQTLAEQELQEVQIPQVLCKNTKILVEIEVFNLMHTYLGVSPIGCTEIYSQINVIQLDCTELWCEL